MTKLNVNLKKDQNFTFWHSQKIWFLGLVIGSLLAFHTTAEAIEGNPVRLFLDSHLIGTLRSGAIDESLIILRRACQINFEKLAKVEEDKPECLLLNLFDDTVFIALLDRIETDPMLGGYAWIGRLEGIKDSEVTLVFKDGRLSGTIIFPGGHFQVRHAEDSVHEIREIDSEQMSVVLEAVACSDLFSQESQMIVLVNQERAVNSLHLYACDQRLVTSSRAHSTDMATNDFFSHTVPGEPPLGIGRYRSDMNITTRGKTLPRDTALLRLPMRI